MIDAFGYRISIGVIISNNNGQIFLGKRIGKNAWQFPQGGVLTNEDLTKAMYREVQEEVGIPAESLVISRYSQCWLRYKIPQKLQREHSYPLCIGQKQKWFLLRYLGKDEDIDLASSAKAEFDDWLWVNYWYPLSIIINFKKEVYRKVLLEFAPYFFRDKEIKKHSIDLDFLL